MAELIWRLRCAAGPRPSTRAATSRGCWSWAARRRSSLGWALTVSIQATCAFVLIVVVIALHQNDRSWGIVAMFGLWFMAPLLRRVFALITGPRRERPAVAGAVPGHGRARGDRARPGSRAGAVRRILLLAAAGFAIGLPVGLLAGPRAAIYAFIAYLAGVSGAVLGFGERAVASATARCGGSSCSRCPPIAAYAIAQHYLPFPIVGPCVAGRRPSSRASATSPGRRTIRAFSSLNSPGALAPLLGLSLLCYLTIARHRADRDRGRGADRSWRCR